MRRLFWMAAGATLATGGTRWTKRKASAVAAHLDLPKAGKQAAGRVRHRLSSARREGRAAMADTEARLKSQLR